MLECHRVDVRIIEAIRRRDGATAREIMEALSTGGDHPVSLTTIQRHLPGLLALGAITGEIKSCENKRVAVWKATKTF